MSMPNQVK